MKITPVHIVPAALALLVGINPEPSLGQSLDEALAMAYSENPTLLAARAELRGVNEGVPQELSNYRPSAFVDGQGGIQRIDRKPGNGAETTEPLDVTLSVEQPLYRGGRTVAGVARAEAEVQSERAQLTTVEQGVLLDAVTSYMDVWRDEAIVRLNKNNEKVLARQLEATNDRFEVGELTRTDVAQSESRLARATADRIASEGDLTASAAVYQEIVGAPPGELSPPPALAGLPTVQDEVVSRARENNPDVIDARFTQTAAERQIEVSRGQLLPEAFLTGEASHEREFTSDDNETDSAQALLEVTVPIYQSGSVYSEVRESKQVASQRAREVEEAERSSVRFAIQAWEGLQTARAQTRSFEAEVRSTNIALDGVRQENAVGARTILDILDAEQEFLDAQVNLTRAQRDEVVASYAVLSAMGQLTARDLALNVEVYNPEQDYQTVRNKWFGLDAPGQ